MRLLPGLRRERGYTMVEMITVMLILSIVMTGITTVFVQGSNAELDMNNRFQAQTNARLGLDKIRKDIHCASAVPIPASQTDTWVSSVQLTGPCVAQSTVSTVGALSGTGTGTFSIAYSAGFPTALTTYQIGTETMTGTLAGTTVTVTARGVNGTTAAAHPLNSGVVAAGGTVSWCAVTVGTNMGLYRQLGTAACGSSSPAIRQIDRLTTTNVFYYQAPFSGSLAMIWVKLPVNTATAKHLGSSTDGYTLCDGVLLRNGVRAGSGHWPTLTPPATSPCG